MPKIGLSKDEAKLGQGEIERILGLYASAMREMVDADEMVERNLLEEVEGEWAESLNRMNEIFDLGAITIVTWDEIREETADVPFLAKKEIKKP